MFKKLLPIFLALAAALVVFVTGSSYAKDRPEAVGRLRSCEVREAAIKRRMTHLSDLVTKMLDVFDKKATKVEDFYTNKLVPKGKTLSNYALLVSDIQTKKTAVQTALSKAQTDVNGFNCTGDIKAQMHQFRLDMQAVKRALKDYRTAVVNLIRAVRSLNGELESGK